MTSMARVAAFAALLFASLGAADPSLPALEGVRFEQRLGQTLPLKTVATDEHGQRQELARFFGTRPVIVVFTYFRCPNLCTLVLNGLVDALKALPQDTPDYSVLALSIAPNEKPPLALAKKRTYLAKLGRVERGANAASWHFLTADANAIGALTEAAGFHYRLDPRSGEYEHPSGIVVVSPKAKISQYFFGIQFNSAALRQAIVSAAREAKGSWVEEILLYCFHYDPNLGGNSSLILWVIRVAGGVGAAGLLAFLAYLFASSRKEAQP